MPHLTTLDAMAAVVAELQRRGLPASLEHPGWIALQGWAIGTANGTWAANREDLARDADSGIPADFEDPELIADGIMLMCGLGVGGVE